MGFAVVGLFYSGIGWPDSGVWCCLLLRCVGGLRFRCGGFVLVFWWGLVVECLLCDGGLLLVLILFVFGVVSAACDCCLLSYD